MDHGTDGVRSRWRQWYVRWCALDEHEGLGTKQQCWIFLLVMFLLWTRRPGELLHPQFYAEDGALWYAQAYNFSWLHSLAMPAGGYLNTLQRLGAGVAMLFPFRDAPLVMNVIGMLIQALPVTALLSRGAAPWGPLRLRALMATLYIIVPNAPEIHVVLTNAQWHFALLEVIVAFGAAPRRAWLWAVDAVLFLIGGFSGPFGILLVPLVLICWWVRRKPWSLVVAALLLPGVLVQGWFLLFTERIPRMPLGASVMLFLRLMGGHVFVDSMAGANPLSPLLPAPILLGTVVFGFIVIGFGLMRGGLNLRLFALFAAMVYGAGMASPLIAGPKPLWQLMIVNGGARYVFFPMMVFVWSAMFCMVYGKKWIAWAGKAVFVVMIFGATRQWVYKGFSDHQFQQYATRFEALHPGETEIIPIQPDPTVMKLVKH